MLRRLIQPGQTGQTGQTGRTRRTAETRQTGQTGQTEPTGPSDRAGQNGRTARTGRTRRSRPADQKELAQYNTSDARTYFAQLLERVRHGEEIVIARAGKPVAKLVPFDDDRPRHSGVIRAHVVMRRR